MKLIEVSRGISHIEDLPATEIIEILSNLSDYNITEKVDGAQMLFGIDEKGFYTSRESKGGIRVYNEANYGITFSSTYMRSAHKLLEQMLPELRGAGLRSGDQVEAEVLYGELPNVVPYSADTNYLIFLRTTEGTVNIDRMHQKLDGQSVSVSLVSPFTEDGRSIGLREEVNQWKFSRVPLIEHNLPNSRCTDIRRFLEQKDTLTGQTNGVVLETPLNKIPDWVAPGTWKEVKEYIKERRTLIQTTLNEEYVAPLKERLLNDLVRKAPSAFGPTLEEGGWIEGVVLRHNTTGKMVKIVDKSVFGTIRESAWEKRNMLIERAKGVNSTAGFVGSLFLDLATSLGHPELGTNQAKNYLRKAGTITEERLDTLSEGVNLEVTRNYWISLLDIRKTDLNEDLDKYEEEKIIDVAGPGRFLGTAVQTRTRQTFAETFQQISKMQTAAIQATKVSDLIIALVGKQLGEI